MERKKNNRGKWVYKTQCASCEEDVWREQSELNRNKNSYCSTRCLNIAISIRMKGSGNCNYNPDKITECVECGNPITKGSKSGLCKSCAKIGSRAYQWNGGISTFLKQIRNLYAYKVWMRMVLERDDYTCQYCFSEDHIEVHHKKDLKEIVSENNITTIEQAKECDELWDVDNGISLCVHCHAEEHPDLRNVILTRLKVV